jgi:hypothetical protein
MALKGAEQVLLFDAFFIILLTLFGGATTGANPFQALQTIPQPPLAPQPGNISCNQLDYVCNASKGVAQATAYVGWAIVNVPVLAIYFLLVIIVFSNLVLSIVFSPVFSSNGVPILGFIFTAMQLIVLFEVIRIFRGSSSGF